MKKNRQKNTEKGRKYVKVLGINVLVTHKAQVLTRVKNFLSHNVQFYIVTPNPELILVAQKNLELKKALNNADFAIPDAIGLSQAAKYLSLKLPDNKVLMFIVGFIQGLRVGAATFLDRKWLTTEIKPIKGRVLFLELIKLARKNKWKLFFLGGKDNEAELAAEKLKVKNEKLKVAYVRGPILDENVNPVTDLDRKLGKDAIDKIDKFAPDLLFVAMTNPKQEIWIYRNLSKLNVGGAMAVGGTFRYIAGLSQLPPKWMERFGLEWVWRLLTEPQRIRRVLNAFPLFPLKVFWYKISGK